MNDPNRLLKWLLVIALIVASLIVLYPPERKLKGGIDLVGGTSLLFEIDTSGIAPGDISGLSAKVMKVLRERVDPHGQMNLEWRPVGATRLEVRMPQPPKVAIERRKKYNEALKQLGEMNITRFEVESALNLTEPERSAALKKLEKGVSERAPLIDALLSAHQLKTASQKETDPVAVEAANNAYEKASSDLLATSLPFGRLTDILGLPENKRQEQLQKLRSEFPAYDVNKQLTKVVDLYDQWSANKGSLEDPSDLKRLLRGAGVLEFRILADRDPTSPQFTTDPNPSLKQPIARYAEQLQKFGPRLKAGDQFRWLPVGEILDLLNVKDMAEVERVKESPGVPIVQEYAGKWYVLVHNDAEHVMLKSTGTHRWALVRAAPDRNQLTGQNVVSFQLDARGGTLFRKLTGANVLRQLAISLDETIMSHARINEEIGERCQISGQFTPEKVSEYVKILDAGSLPARLKETPLAEKTIGPSLGLTNRTNGIWAAFLGFMLVIVFIAFYYGLVGGGMADVALVLNLLFTLAIMALMQATFTLPGIAGLVLSVGMAIDANVLIFERIREEVARGMIFKKALNAGYEKAFSAIFDGNLTTLITCVILGFVGSEEVKGFAITLGVGIATSMFTALTVTRLVFNTLVAAGLLDGFRMQRLIGIPKIDWVGLRRIFWSVSTTIVVLGLGLFVWMGFARTQKLFDIEFLGGTSVQIDLKPGMALEDEEVRAKVTETGTHPPSAAQWLLDASEDLLKATVEDGETAGQFKMTSNKLTGDQLAALMRDAVEDKLERGGVHTFEHTATFDAKTGQLTLAVFKEAASVAAAQANEASNRLRNARVQSVGEVDSKTKKALSFEIMTTETNRDMVQAAIVAALSQSLQIQRAIAFQAVRDDVMTKEPYFVVEADDHYLSDVIGGNAINDVRKYRSGAVVVVQLDPTAEPLTVHEFEERMREIVLLPEFEQYQNRDREIFPLGEAMMVGGDPAHRRFAVATVDESLFYDKDPVLWADNLAKPTLSQIEAALGREKSLSQVIQFDKQIAGQSTSRAVFAAVLAMISIGAYVWFRFGTKDFGLAVLVCLVHDVAVMLGFVALSHYIYNTFLGRALLIDDFKMDMTMVAAVLTIIGYSLNDTIVVFDRIRENRGKLDTLSANLINSSLNQTMSRTILTSLTVFLTVLVLYIFGGDGVHGFSYAMLIGTISGTYSTVGIAVPLVYRPKTLRTVSIVIAALMVLGIVFISTDVMVIRLVLAALTLIICGLAWNKYARVPSMASRELAGSR